MPTKGWFLTISISASPTGVTLIAPYTGTADFFLWNKPELGDFRDFCIFNEEDKVRSEKVP